LGPPRRGIRIRKACLINTQISGAWPDERKNPVGHTVAHFAYPYPEEIASSQIAPLKGLFCPFNLTVEHMNGLRVKFIHVGLLISSGMVRLTEFSKFYELIRQIIKLAVQLFGFCLFSGIALIGQLNYGAWISLVE